MKRYWLMKTEPQSYSIDDLKRDGTTFWNGVRNYQARNFMRDDMKPGDGVLFHHSSADPPGIYGIAEVVKSAYPDHTQFDPESKYFDPKATPDNPIWFMVDLKFVRKFAAPIPLSDLKETAGLEDMMVTKRGSRLSVQPVTADEWKIVTGMRKK